MGLEGVAVSVAERVSELLVRIGEVVAEGLGGEVQTTVTIGKISLCMGRVGENHIDWMEAYRFSQTRPSVAVCFFSLSSLSTSSWRVPESVGAASWRSRIF